MSHNHHDTREKQALADFAATHAYLEKLTAIPSAYQRAAEAARRGRRQRARKAERDRDGWNRAVREAM